MSKDKRLKKRKRLPAAQQAGLDKGMFKKGQVTNPQGRPKGDRNLATVLRKYCERPATEIDWVKELAVKLGMKVKEVTVQDVVMASLVMQATIKGKTDLMRELLNRLDGAVEQKVSHEVKQLTVIVRQANVERVWNEELGAHETRFIDKGEE